MAPRSPQARLRLAAVGMMAALVWTAGARADVLHAIYRVSLLGVPIGGSVSVLVTPWSTLHPAASSVMPTSVMPDSTHPKRFIASNRRSVVAG